MNDEYYQIFIDNFQGKEKYDIFNILSEKTEVLANKFLVDSSFIENKIYQILNYLKPKIYNENDKFNERYFNDVIAENIIKNNKILNELISKNLEKQALIIAALKNQ